MDPQPLHVNPYASPVAGTDELPPPRCSYCGREASATGPLVEAPAQRAYICGSCAQIVIDTIANEHAAKGGRSPAGRVFWGVVRGAFYGGVISLLILWAGIRRAQLGNALLMNFWLWVVGGALIGGVAAWLLAHPKRVLQDK